MIFVFWISLGQNLFTSAPSEPWLPSNPRHQCSIDLTFPANATISDSSTFNHNITISLSDTASRIAAYEDEMDMFRSFNPQGIDKLYSVSFRWFGAIGILLTIGLGSIVSLLTDHPSAVEVDVRYILPLGDQLFPYLPKKARRYLNFGVDFGKRRRWLEQQTAGTINTQEFCGEIKVELEEVKANDELSVLSTGGVNAFTEKIERTSDTSIM
ncbi:sodium-dependent multivitamin transporter-like [Ylistrum balloti]|uniref:sodium-dependent multivitamin transporter-like n=1 Tax=Ylistrum balloti TaxID=509963 RepID=UPI002905BC2C|nr:sodium-dependent multivitamin transporter-like [Ylistrum balloti]